MEVGYTGSIQGGSNETLQETYITELGLCRSIRTSLDKCSVPPEELIQLLVENIDSTNTASPIGIQDGPVLRKALRYHYSHDRYI